MGGKNFNWEDELPDADEEVTQNKSQDKSEADKNKSDTGQDGKAKKKETSSENTDRSGSDDPKAPAKKKKNKSSSSKALEMPNKDDKVKPYTVNLYDTHKDIIQALAYYRRKSQREIIEEALESYCEDKELKEALKTYRNQQ